MEHNVQLTEDLVENLTPEKGTIDEQTRIAILEKLADSLMLQGSYHLATKKFTQAGDKVPMFNVKFVLFVIVFSTDKSHKIPVKIWRHRKNHLFRHCLPPKRNLHHGGELSSIARLAKQTRHSTQHNHFLFKGKIVGFTRKLLRGLCTGGNRRIPKLREGVRRHDGGVQVSGESGDTCATAQKGGGYCATASGGY